MARAKNNAVAIRTPELDLGDIADRLNSAHSFALGIEAACVGFSAIGDPAALQVLLQAHQQDLLSIQRELEAGMGKKE